MLEVVGLSLTQEEVLRLEMILIDEDKDEALRFLKECIKKKIERQLDDHKCSPEWGVIIPRKE